VRSVSVGVDVRYRGQAHELTIPLGSGDGWDAVAARFHDEHRIRNGFARRDDPIEVVAVRAAAIGVPALAWDDLPEIRPGGDAGRGTRTVHTKAGPVDASVFDRSRLGPGDEVVGPAVVEEDEATTYLAPGERAEVHPNGALEITW
jgi:N-methylhydantoinase A